nr:Ku protein [uncultured Pseudomonas sp.]
MARALWKGAISFGLVHIPVALVSATTSQGIDFDWLDQRSMQPVGYKRINKVSGEEVTREDIVKGVEIEDGRYVVISEDEIRAAHPKSTQSIDIFAFIEREQIPVTHIEKPYYLAPDKRGEKVYALLRETLRSTGKVALARVVLHTKQHLAALLALDDAMVLLMLRWPAEVRGLDYLELSDKVRDVELAKGELDMAKRLVEDMVASWDPQAYHDTFEEKIMQLVDEKARKGKVEDVERSADEQASTGADIYDLTELLKRSLSGGTKGQTDKPEAKQPAKRSKGSGKTSRKTASR